MTRGENLFDQILVTRFLNHAHVCQGYKLLFCGWIRSKVVEHHNGDKKINEVAFFDVDQTFPSLILTLIQFLNVTYPLKAMNPCFKVMAIRYNDNSHDQSHYV